MRFRGSLSRKLAFCVFLSLVIAQPFLAMNYAQTDSPADSVKQEKPVFSPPVYWLFGLIGLTVGGAYGKLVFGNPGAGALVGFLAAILLADYIIALIVIVGILWWVRSILVR